jgi:putative nucleotidyltransferase with HDIG domain
MAAMERALILHRSERVLREISDALRPQISIDLAHSDDEAMARTRGEGYAVILIDHHPPVRDARILVAAMAQRHPDAFFVVLTDTLDGVEFNGSAPGRVYRFLGDIERKWELCGLVAQGLRLGKLERERVEMVRKLGTEYARLQKREKLLDAVVFERTRELENAYNSLKAANRQLLLGLAEAIEAKDAYTKGHCGRVAAYSLALAHATHYRGDYETMEYAAFLHDIGKIGVRDAVLQKPGPLVEDEWTHMRIHPVVGDQIASQIELLKPLRPAIRNHHERWDGKGYPDKLRGDDIPIEARIVCIADAFDAMITDRPYKRALPLEDCYGFLRKGMGGQFDPDLAELFIKERIGEG